MGYTCKGKCDVFRHQHPHEWLGYLNQRRYREGWKWCVMCRIGMKIDQLLCFCCRVKLRIRVHSRNVHEDKSSEPRRCLRCDSDKTYSFKGLYPSWRTFGNGYLCRKCYDQLRFRPDECKMLKEKLGMVV